MATEDETGRLRAELEAVRASERELRRSHAELSDFFENASIGLHWVGPDGAILWANASELEMLGYTRDEYLGRHIAEFHVDQPAIADILARLGRDETLRDYPARLRCKDGTIRDVLINSNVLWEEGKFAHTRCFTRDVTAMVRAQEERERLVEREREARLSAERALRARDDFLSIAAHELKTPVTSLRLAAELTLKRLDVDGALDPDRLRRALLTVDEQSIKLTRLVGQLLDVSRLDAGQLELELQPVDLVALVDRIAVRMGEATRRHEIRVRAPAELLAVADPWRIAEIVEQFVENAIAYSPDGSLIDIEVVGVDGGAKVAVTDRGIGVPAEHRSRIFERFYQVDPAGAYSGMGLGLAICRQLAELHGGRVAAEFPDSGGSRFSLFLPGGGSAVPADEL